MKFIELKLPRYNAYKYLFQGNLQLSEHKLINPVKNSQLIHLGVTSHVLISRWKVSGYNHLTSCDPAGLQ